MVSGGGLLNWCPSFCIESHSSYLLSECSTITGTDPSKATLSLHNVFCLAECSSLHSALLGPESFILWKLHSYVDDKVLIQPEIDERTRKNVHVFVFFFCANNFEGCISFEWTAAYQRNRSYTKATASGRTCEGRFVKHKRYFHSGSLCSSLPPTQKERWNSLNISAFLHAQVAVGSVKG